MPLEIKGITQITNSTSSVIGLMAEFEPGSREYNRLADRVKMGCAAQSRQIDKTKIGEAVKGVATCWKQFQRAKDGDTPEEIKEKEFLNSILVDKKPYFFRYKYRQLNKELNEYNRNSNETAKTRFKKTLEELQNQQLNNPESLTQQEKDFLFYYKKFLPVLDSDCVMNRICHYIESVDFEIKKKVRSTDGFNWQSLVSENFQPDKKLTQAILDVIEEEMEKKKSDIKSLKLTNPSLVRKNSVTLKDEFDKEAWINYLRARLEEVCSNDEKLSNHLVYIFYVEKQSLNKSVLWSLVGKTIYEIIKSKTNSFYFPMKNSNGSIRFLYDNYSIEKVILSELEEEDSDNQFIENEESLND